MSYKRRNLPNTASVAEPQAGGKLHAPSAERNRDAITEAITPFLPAQGRVLEIASGTGQHVVRYAAAYPEITWQPTDVEDERLDSIASWCADVGLRNILAPKMLDATKPGWAQAHAGQEAVMLSNLLHLISEAEAHTLVDEASKTLKVGGVFLAYGPFLRGTGFASENDRLFHESLQETDTEIGYKTVVWVQDQMKNAGLTLGEPVEMPSNNLILSGRKA